MLRNAASMWNTGIEIGLTANIRNSKDISWVSAINYSSMKNEVTSLAADFYSLTGAFVGCTNTAIVDNHLEHSVQLVGYAIIKQLRTLKQQKILKIEERTMFLQRNGSI